MTAFLDTNVLVRHLTGDPPEMAARATACLSRTDGLIVADLVVAEIVYVLEKFYGTPRSRVAAVLEAMISAPQVQIRDRPLLIRALEVYETHRIDFAEAYLVASAERAGITDIVSFDRAIDRVDTVNRVEPQPETPTAEAERIDRAQDHVARGRGPSGPPAAPRPVSEANKSTGCAK